MKTRIAGILLLSCVAAFAQGADKKAPEPAKGASMTMTGCLTKGADTPQHYNFTDQASGKKWTVTGPADLEKHSANHTVRLTGAETAKVFAATKVEHVAATCQAKAAAPSK
ncbi:MAG TPA: hypothetical protein VER03_07760 [Bryobacteraceae bacterium]|nr:hypothetical protein [Bryobacteraceae bacterium]